MRVWVLDTSSIMEIQRCGFSEGDQFDVFVELLDLVERGDATVCRHVINECKNGKFVDVPHGWASSVRDKVQYPLEAEPEHLRKVMAAAGDVCDQHDTEKDEADPYVLALAYQLREQGLDPRIVSEDRMDRPPRKISMHTAADRLGLQCVRLIPFLQAVGLLEIQRRRGT